MLFVVRDAFVSLPGPAYHAVDPFRSTAVRSVVRSALVVPVFYHVWILDTRTPTPAACSTCSEVRSPKGNCMPGVQKFPCLRQLLRAWLPTLPVRGFRSECRKILLRNAQRRHPRIQHLDRQGVPATRRLWPSADCKMLPWFWWHNGWSGVRSAMQSATGDWQGRFPQVGCTQGGVGGGGQRLGRSVTLRSKTANPQ
jgi:hypothetical protein